MAFFMQMRPALYIALIALSPLILLIDKILPAERFAWSRPAMEGVPDEPCVPLEIDRPVAAILAPLLAGPAAAFCGFYVAKADAKLFNKSSKVVLSRDGETTAMTMASDYEGEPKEFALVIPVPTFIERRQIGVVDMKTIDHLDAFTAPRLVEYHDPDPVRAGMYRQRVANGGMPAPAAAAANRGQAPRRHRRGQLRCRRIRRLDPVGDRE